MKNIPSENVKIIVKKNKMVISFGKQLKSNQFR